VIMFTSVFNSQIYPAADCFVGDKDAFDASLRPAIKCLLQNVSELLSRFEGCKEIYCTGVGELLHHDKHHVMF